MLYVSGSFRGNVMITDSMTKRCQQIPNESLPIFLKITRRPVQGIKIDKQTNRCTTIESAFPPFTRLINALHKHNIFFRNAYEYDNEIEIAFDSNLSESELKASLTDIVLELKNCSYINFLMVKKEQSDDCSLLRIFFRENYTTVNG